MIFKVSTYTMYHHKPYNDDETCCTCLPVHCCRYSTVSSLKAKIRKYIFPCIYQKIIYHPCLVYGRKSVFGIYRFSNLSGETHLTPGGSKYILQNQENFPNFFLIRKQLGDRIGKMMIPFPNFVRYIYISIFWKLSLVSVNKMIGIHGKMKLLVDVR